MRTIKSSRTKRRPSPAGSELQSFIQRKLIIGASNDVYEKEADDMANKIIGDTPGQLKFTSANQLQKKESNADPVSAPPIVQDVLSSSSGRNMDEDTRSYMESRFNYDFSDVKIQDNELAAKSASSINALAYTSGNNIVFNSGQYNPGSDPGKKLLAHELTHVVQQNGCDFQTGGWGIIQRQADDPCSVDKIWGTWDAMKETLCHMKCDLPFTGKDCDKECDDEYSIWAKLKKCRQEHPLPPTPDPWDEPE